MVDRYAKFATENLTVAAARIENGQGGSVIEMPHSEKQKGQRLNADPYMFWLPDLDSNQGPAD